MNHYERQIHAELLRYVLLEIRALEDSDLPRARDLANIVHNLPTALVSHDVDWNHISKNLRSRAAAHKLEGYIDGLIAHIGLVRPNGSRR